MALPGGGRQACRRVLASPGRQGRSGAALDGSLHAAQTCNVLAHMLPMKDQARTAIWTAINPHTGIRRIDEAFPDALFVKRETDMMITCKANASTWQIKGDNFGAGIGSPPYGLVFSEYSRANPNAWAYLRPILKENGGWAMFISTAFGHNHFEKLLNYAQQPDNDWFGELLTVDDTGILSPADVAQELRELTAER